MNLHISFYILHQIKIRTQTNPCYLLEEKKKPENKAKLLNS